MSKELDASRQLMVKKQAEIEQIQNEVCIAAFFDQ